MNSGESVDVVFAVQVEPEEDPVVVSNVAVIEAGSEIMERRVLTIVNARHLYLPVTLKGR